jgi:hypothetical protein
MRNIGRAEGSGGVPKCEPGMDLNLSSSLEDQAGRGRHEVRKADDFFSRQAG